MGFNIGIELGKGEPANDMIGAGLYTHYKFSNGLLMGFAFDSMAYDYEHPVNYVNINQASQALQITLHGLNNVVSPGTGEQVVDLVL